MMLSVLVAAALQAGSLPVQTAVRPGGAAPTSSRVSAIPARRPPKSASSKTLPVRTLARVVIDAGHGGPDVGGPMRMGTGIHEKDVTLQVALKVGEALRQRGVDVVYTRTKDTLIALRDRGKIANQANGDVFISIHVNAANPQFAAGPTARRPGPSLLSP